MQKTITPPASILESSKDDFIPVVNVNAQIEIEVTKPTEVTDNQVKNEINRRKANLRNKITNKNKLFLFSFKINLIDFINFHFYQSHSNPGTPYQGTASVPYRKPSITRSNIKRKE